MKRRTIVGIAFSALFLFFALRGVDRSGVGEALSRADYRVLPVVFALMLVSLFLRALRWRFLFRPDYDIGLPRLFSASAIGMMANNILPARLGELVRAWVIGSRERISKSTSLATIVVERIFDGFTVLFFLGALVVWRSGEVPDALRVLALAAAAIFVAALALLLLIHSRRGVALAAAKALSRPLPERAGRRLTGLVDAFVGGLAVLRSPADVVAASILSLCVWIPNVAAIYFVLLSFGLGLPPHASVVVFVIVTLGIMIPSAPGFVGTIQYGFILALGLFGVSESLALSVSIVYHAGVYIPLTAAGLVCLAVEGISLGAVRRAAAGNDGGGE